MTASVYQILNIVTGKTYIGSSVDYKRRWTAHLYYLRKGVHSSIKLQNSYNKHGKNSFRMSCLETFEYEKVQDILDKEQYYIDTLKPYYNIAPIAGSCLGVKHIRNKILNLSTGKIYNSIRDAAVDNNLNEISLTKRIRGNSPNSTGLVFLDNDLRKESEDRYIKYKRIRCRIIQKVSLDGKTVLEEYKSANYAAECLGYNAKTIRIACDTTKQSRKIKDYILKYKYD